MEGEEQRGTVDVGREKCSAISLAGLRPEALGSISDHNADEGERSGEERERKRQRDKQREETETERESWC